MIYSRAHSLLPVWLRRYLLHFDYAIEDAVREFALSLPAGAAVLDAGAGESRHRAHFGRQRYVALDLAVGDSQWDYAALDVLGDLARLPLRDATFDAALNIVTLEHVKEPAAVLRELARVLKPGARLLIVVPHEWEVHQAPHDFFRYTSHGLRYLLESAGFAVERLDPVGGYFRLMSRRVLNGLQFFPGPFFALAALVAVPVGLLLPLLDGLDRQRNFTLGYRCVARKLGAISPSAHRNSSATTARPVVS